MTSNSQKGNQKESEQPKDPKELITNSGHTLTLRIRDMLKNNGWTTTLSPFYVDSLTNKIRENDIIATKRFPITDVQDRSSPISVALVIECKYNNKNTTIFWFDPINIDKARKSRNAHNSNPNYYKIHTLSDNGGQLQLVGKLVQEDKGQQFYEGMNQCLHGLIMARENYFGSNKLFGPERIYLEYPAFITNTFSHYYDGTCKPITDNFLFEVDYSYPKSHETVNEYFLIDVVSETLFSNYLKKIDEDVNSIEQVIKNCTMDEIHTKLLT